MGQTRTLMQEEISKIIEWASTWKMSINTDKTKAMIISSNTKETNSDPQLKSVYGVIATVSKYKFLGVKIDSGLRFNEHLSDVLKKCRRRVNIIKSMAWKDWGNSLEVQRTLYIQYVTMYIRHQQEKARDHPKRSPAICSRISKNLPV